MEGETDCSAGLCALPVAGSGKDRELHITVSSLTTKSSPSPNKETNETMKNYYPFLLLFFFI